MSSQKKGAGASESKESTDWMDLLSKHAVKGAIAAAALVGSALVAKYLIDGRQDNSIDPTALYQSPHNHIITNFLRNSYILVRHGESTANQLGLISSSPEIATVMHGLSERGVRQASMAGVELVSVAGGRDVTIITSDYKRAFETASIIREVLKLDETNFEVNKKLRERFFGEYDATSSNNYHKVWKEDLKDAASTKKGVESVNSVLDRTSKLVMECEERFSRRVIVLVAHGDTLQILETAFHRIDPRFHKSLPPIENAVLLQKFLRTTNDRSDRSDV